MRRTVTPRQQAARPRRLGYLAAAATLVTALLLAFAPAVITFGTGVSSAVAWCYWLDTLGDDSAPCSSRRPLTRARRRGPSRPPVHPEARPDPASRVGRHALSAISGA